MTTNPTPPQPAGELPVAAIMSYWGAQVTYDFYCLGMVGHVSEPDCWMPFHRVLNNGDVVFEITDCADRVRNFKLHLFPLSSLSDEQVRELARLAGIVAEPGTETSIERQFQSVTKLISYHVGDYCFSLYWDDVAFELYNRLDGRYEDINQASLCAWLRRNHFFVEGEVGREWVELI